MQLIPEPFPIFEGDYMHALGIADRDDMRSMREELLTVDVDWARVGLRVMLSKIGAEKLAHALNVFPSQLAAIRLAQSMAGLHQSPAPESSPLGATAERLEALKTASEKTPVVRLLVVPTRVLNPHILLCRLPDLPAHERARWVNVRVKSNTNFLPLPADTGEILARHIEGKLYEFAGNPRSQKNDVPRCPRWPGRW